jgi:hypothetical protein
VFFIILLISSFGIPERESVILELFDISAICFANEKPSGSMDD